MTGDPLFIFRLTPLVLSMAGLEGSDAEALVAECGLPPSAAEGTMAAPLSCVKRLVAEAAERSGRRPFGLALAAAVPFGTYGLPELLVRTAPSLERGLSELSAHASLINPVGRFDVRESQAAAKGETEIHYFVHGTDDALGPTINEYTIAYLHRAMSALRPEPLPVTRVWFSHARSADADAVGAHFGVDVRYGARTCGFAMCLDGPTSLSTSDAVVFDYLRARGREELQARGQRSAVAVVVETIETQLGFATADLDAVAACLGQTPRTVQRRLAAEGTTFRETLETARKRRAEAMLAEGTPFGTVADALGFSGVRSFRRAYQRWVS